MKNKWFGCSFAVIIIILLLAIATAYPSCQKVDVGKKMKMEQDLFEFLFILGDEHLRSACTPPSITNRLSNDLFCILLRDNVAELDRRIENGLSPNSEYFHNGSFPDELAYPLLWYAVGLKAEGCVRLLLKRGASVTRPNASNKIAIQWAEDMGTPGIAKMIESLNQDTNLLTGLQVTNAIMRLCPPGSVVTPPADVPIVVVCENETDFGQEKRNYVNKIPLSKCYSVLGVSTNGPYPLFEYEIQTDRERKTFGGKLSRHRGFYIITNFWVYDH